MNVVDVVPNGRRRDDHVPRWKLLFTPQATTLLLVIAVVLLSYVTIQGTQASNAAKQAAVANRALTDRQDRASVAADLSSRRQEVVQAKLAKDTASALLDKVSASNAASTAELRTVVEDLRKNLVSAIDALSKAIARLQQSVDRYAAADAQRDKTTCTQLVVVGCMVR